MMLILETYTKQPIWLPNRPDARLVLVCLMLLAIALSTRGRTFSEDSVSSSEAAWVHVEETVLPHDGHAPAHVLDGHDDVNPQLHEQTDSHSVHAYTAMNGVSVDWAQDSQLACDACGSHQCECYGVDTDPGHPRKPRRKMPGDRDRSDCPPLRYRMDDQQRSGCSASVAPWAQCGRRNTKYGQYTAWFVGGGAAFAKVPTLPLPLLSRGRDRKSNACGQHAEGTWGLDYEGLAGYSKVWLQYTQGRKQGGEGRYQTDGEPKLIAKVKGWLHH